ncbi:Indole-3-acetyl-aspartic acid hydrolase [Serratia proteamaculans]|nr:Indole-3-acetyl-aspartic acid hydrolase [Serratia proteamaculans]
MNNPLSMLVSDLSPQLQAWRRDFHRYAESGWFEFRTATLVAEELDRLGYRLQLGREVINADARMGLPSAEALQAQEQRAREQGALDKWLPHFSGGFAGIVATLDTGRPGPVIAYRVDMDALDLNEKLQPDHLPFREGFASCNSGMMHACGHDGHTTIGLGLARIFKSLEPQLTGTIKLIFQPAEEGTRGAKSMVEAGVVDDVDFFTAVHIGTGVAAGELVCGSDSFMATSKLDVTYRGVASHAGAKPEDGRSSAGHSGSVRHPTPQRRQLTHQRRRIAGRNRPQRDCRSGIYEGGNPRGHQRHQRICLPAGAERDRRRGQNARRGIRHRPDGRGAEQ